MNSERGDFRNPIHTTEGRLFYKVFKKSVLDFWCPITGFDVVKFDEWVETPDGVSCKDHIAKKFGKDSVSLVERLMKVKP